MEYRQLTRTDMQELESRILYEDNHILIVNKKAGEIVQGDKTGDECLADTFKAYIAQRDSKPGKVFMGIPHRLDRPVSGICMLAKTSKALERLSEMFRNGDVHKTYLALCCARPEEDEGHLENWLLRNEARNKSYILKHEGKDARLAKLNYRYIASTDRYHLLEVELLTGRHHQIRCQLSGIGCVIKGDLKYGAARPNKDGSICLHSYRVSFTHPVKHIPICVTAPVPESWKGVSSILPSASVNTLPESPTY